MDNKLYRSASFDNTTLNVEERTVELSFSSELPYMRKDGFEILSHREGDYDFSFISSGQAPLLLDHSATRQVGAVMTASVVDGRGKAIVKISRSEQGEELLRDIEDGIKTSISVGYSTTTRKLDGQIDGTNAYRYTWIPHEISFVALPADPTVGVGRNTEITEPTILENKDILPMSTENLEIKEIEEASRAASVTTTNRAASIADIEAICKRYGFEDHVEALVTSERSLDEVKAEIVKLWTARNKETKVSQAPAIHVKQERSFDMGKAFRAAASQDWSQAGYEREMGQEYGKSAPTPWERNTVVLSPEMTNPKSRASNTVGGATSGAELIGTNYMPERLIDALWNKTFLNQVGTDSMLGLVGNASFPIISSNATSVFQGETATLPAAQALTTGLKSISPKQLVSKFQYSRQLLIQGLPNIEAKILEQLYNSIAQKLDAVALANSGTTLSTTGLLNEVTQVIAAGTNGGVPTLKNFYDMRKALVNAKTFQGNLAFAISGSLNETLATTLKDSANTASGYILNEGQTTLAGLPLVWSQNIPNNLTKGTHTTADLSAAILGNWDDFLVAQWGSIALQFDDISLADSSQYVIRSYSFWDMLIKRLESFAVVKDFIA